MAIRRANNLYLYGYFSFFISEIPNLIQIVGFPSLLGILLDEQITTYIIAAIIGGITGIYLMIKSERYLHQEIDNPNSYLNIRKLSIEKVQKYWTIYMFATTLIIASLAGLLIGEMRRNILINL